MRRRDFITLLGGAAAWPLDARAQQAAVPVVGVLSGLSAAPMADPLAAFHRGLSEAGFVEGRNVAMEYRWADGQLDRLPAMAADLVSRRAAVILAVGADVGTLAAMGATKTIPIVFVTASDPVAAGFVSSLARPAGNVTGITTISVELIAKRLQLLHELLPGAARIALLVNPSNPGMAQSNIEGTQAAARRLGLEIIVLKAATEAEIDSAVATAVSQQAGALTLATDGYFTSRARQIAFLALRHGLPTMGTTRENVSAGILMSYGTSRVDGYQPAGIYVGRILKGDKPENLPVVQPTKFELLIKVTTAKALGLAIPTTLLAVTDEFIE
jgi:putative tryptophan/tyrosine transport system substrate-binding protein